MLIRRFLFRARLGERPSALLERYTESAIVQTVLYHSKCEVTS